MKSRLAAMLVCMIGLYLMAGIAAIVVLGF
jgi:hypothetical protein